MCYDDLMWKIYGLDIRGLMQQTSPDEYMDKLPAERKAQILRMKRTGDRYRSLGAGLVIAYGLCQEGIPLARQNFRQGAYGKPALAEDRGIHFNASHAGNFVVAAVADRSVGIDIERRRQLRNATVRKCCTIREQEWLEKQEDQELAFLRLWTAKESYVKWGGEGLTCPLDTVEVRFPPLQHDECRTAEGQSDIVLSEGYPVGVQPVKIFRQGICQPVILREFGELTDYCICVCGENMDYPRGIRWLSPEELGAIR